MENTTSPEYQRLQLALTNCCTPDEVQAIRHEAKLKGYQSISNEGRQILIQVFGFKEKNGMILE